MNLKKKKKIIIFVGGQNRERGRGFKKNTTNNINPRPLDRFVRNMSHMYPCNLIKMTYYVKLIVTKKAGGGIQKYYFQTKIEES